MTIHFFHPGVRSTLNLHAFVYSLTKTIQYEVFQKEIEILSAVDVMKGSSNNNEFKLDGTVLLENTTPIICLVCLSWFSLKYLNEQKIKKLDTIAEYKDARKLMQVSLLIFVHIFFRNVENAI